MCREKIVGGRRKPEAASRRTRHYLRNLRQKPNAAKEDSKENALETRLDLKKINKIYVEKLHYNRRYILKNMIEVILFDLGLL